MAQLIVMDAAQAPVLNTNIFDVLPDLAWQQAGLAGYCVLAIAAVLVQLLMPRQPRWLQLLLPSLIYMSLFVFSYALIDEVSVNLEHAYNLFHHGRFSMARDAMVDGTVEAVFYLLHTPFGATPRSLLIGNMLICFITGWLHIFVLWRARLFNDARFAMLPLVLLALCINLMAQFANGFGNGLVSLFFLMALLAVAKGHTLRALAMNGILPLLRPDALLWAVMLGGIIMLFASNRVALVRRPAFWPAALSPFFAAALYYGGYQLFYGHALPTPILFKEHAANLSELLSLTPESIARSLLAYLPLTGIASIAGAATLIAMVMVVLAQKNRDALRVSDRALRVFLMAALGSVPFLLVGYASSFPYTNPLERYFLNAHLTLVVSSGIGFYLLAAGGLQHVVEAYRHQVLHMASPLPVSLQAWLPRAGAALLIGGLACLELSGINLERFKEWSRNRAPMALAGAATQKLVPDDWRVATGEMNTFGLMLDRPVLDLWGYSNRRIAASPRCIVGSLKTDAALFLEEKPEIYFDYFFTEFPLPEADRIFEIILATAGRSHGNRKNYDRLGELAPVFEHYDALLLRFAGQQVMYLVRRDKTAALQGQARENGFSETRRREIILTPELVLPSKAEPC